MVMNLKSLQFLERRLFHVSGRRSLVYGSTGVCRVLSIDRRQERVGSIRQERLYYQLKPIYQGGLIYTPVDNDKVSMRPIISRQEAEDLISEIPTLHPAACRLPPLRR